MTSHRVPRVGDWIRFMYGGRLVIDEIAYVGQRSAFDSTPTYMTTQHGFIAVDSILERRVGVGEGGAPAVKTERRGAGNESG